jgi:hypothetical protein
VSALHDQLSRKSVNIEDTVSCFTDTIMVVSIKDAGRAFEGREQDKRRILPAGHDEDHSLPDA